MKYPNPKVIKAKVNLDNRGYLIETFKKKNINTDFKYSILVSSKKNVFRGLHFQKRKQQEKLLIVLKGSIIESFIEKPDLKRANRFLKNKKFTWNSGMYIFKAKVFLDEINKFHPEIYLNCKNSVFLTCLMILK